MLEQDTANDDGMQYKLCNTHGQWIIIKHHGNIEIKSTSESITQKKLLSGSWPATALHTVTSGDSITSIWHAQTIIRGIAWQIRCASCNVRGKKRRKNSTTMANH